jgi:glycosyltransferase involved in cell wall biosynthesis
MSEICDAIALGKPLVVTRSKHLGFDVEEVGCGFFVAAGDVAGWATALARLHRDADLRRKLGEAGPGGSWARQVRHYAEHHANATLCGRQVEAALLRVLRRS